MFKIICNYVTKTNKNIQNWKIFQTPKVSRWDPTTSISLTTEPQTIPRDHPPSKLPVPNSMMRFVMRKDMYLRQSSQDRGRVPQVHTCCHIAASHTDTRLTPSDTGHNCFIIGANQYWTRCSPHGHLDRAHTPTVTLTKQDYLLRIICQIWAITSDSAVTCRKMSHVILRPQGMRNKKKNYSNVNSAMKDARRTFKLSNSKSLSSSSEAAASSFGWLSLAKCIKSRTRLQKVGLFEMVPRYSSETIFCVAWNSIENHLVLDRSAVCVVVRNTIRLVAKMWRVRKKKRSLAQFSIFFVI